MKSPSKKSLKTKLSATDEQADFIIKICQLADARYKLQDFIFENCPATHAYASKCYNDPFNSDSWRRVLILHAIDQVMETYGVEPLGEVEMDGPPYEYLNTGDSYVTTLIYDRDRDKLIIDSVGDLAERKKL